MKIKSLVFKFSFTEIDNFMMPEVRYSNLATLLIIRAVNNGMRSSDGWGTAKRLFGMRPINWNYVDNLTFFKFMYIYHNLFKLIYLTH